MIIYLKYNTNIEKTKKNDKKKNNDNTYIEVVLIKKKFDIHWRV